MSQGNKQSKAKKNKSKKSISKNIQDKLIIPKENISGQELKRVGKIK